MAPTFVCAVPLLLIAFVSARRWYRSIETGRVLVMSHKGIQIFHPEISSRLITWDEYGSARVSWLTGRFKIVNQRGKKILVCYYFRLGSLTAVREFVRTMDGLAQIYTRPDWQKPAQSGPASDLPITPRETPRPSG
jgi:hypothetical protein